MKRWKICCGSLVLIAGLGTTAHAQLPAAPAAIVVPPPGGAVAVTPIAPAAPTKNIFTFFTRSPEQKAACRAKICNSGIGQLVNNGLRPASAMTGGIVPTLCPPVSAADLAQPADSPKGAAARIKMDEIDAKARREAVRELGLQDCHYWPEAQLALINALRADRNECVRLEAAFALGNGCCCSKATIKALTICVSGSEEDGNPSETSERVRAAADGALAHCLACYTEVIPVPPEVKKTIETPVIPGEKPVPPPTPIPPPVGPVAPLQTTTPDKLPNVGKAPTLPADFYKHVETLPRQDIVQEGRRVADRGVTTQVHVEGQPSTAHSVTDIVRNAFNTTPAAGVTVTMPTPTPAPVMVDKNVQPIPVVPVSSPPPLAPVSKATPPASSPSPAPVSKAMPPVSPAVVRGPVLQTSASVPASAYQPAPAQPALEGVKRMPSYQTPTFIPTPPVSEKPPVVPAAPAPATAPEKRPVVPAALAPTPAPEKRSMVPVALAPVPPPEKRPVVAAAPAPTEPTPNLAPAAPQPGMQQSVTDKSQVITVLHNGAHPEQRIWAAQTLGVYDGWTNPDVMQALVKAARTDANTNVRTACVRCLGRMNVCTLSVLSAVQAMKNDRDPAVRAEAELALRQLGEAGPLQMR